MGDWKFFLTRPLDLFTFQFVKLGNEYIYFGNKLAIIRISWNIAWVTT